MILTENDTAEDVMLFENAFKFATIGMALVSPEGKWLKVNQAVCNLLGYTAEELLNINFQYVTHPDDLEADLFYVQELLQGSRQSYQLEKRYFDKNGKLVWTLLSVSLIRKENAEPRFFISQIQDITELKVTQQNLHNNSKLVALGEMSAGMAHEINNPLTVINLHATAIEQILMEQRPDLEMVMKFTHKITDTVKRISTIVTSLKKFSRVSTGLEGFEPSRVGDVLEDALGLCMEKFKSKGVELIVNNPDDPVVECNPLDLSQVIINLINNSYYAVRDLEKKEINIDVQAHGNHITISVIDSGPGISQEVREKIMDPFFTTKPVGEGSGLGLSISKSIIQFHHGEIFLDSVSKKTRFVIKLPKNLAYLRSLSEASSTASRILPI